ncbi:RELT-like protein 2 [Thalassophryne amazonica]|uniref:RELT-like protein 2 n=1 Tax=Thalassophryne amazonica TaxID=390379 RepID=UPI0014716A99|nr:RELT-like protein 2 [Thalassophryne amazonica]XP_034036776.1 RELT-like protein 2 [Thalassophryne amazonica]XP_034036777.1 RELT-like protein 2 [Thalassophryne amazonica]XP_034036778.1 RELT-like protein 2 [Thalassophryne amazonica]XP_034036779.1 RELT-like protein 2 [Thalassophryne amazonica]XP_034036780.1 RELT-like protein 2 [Thalassophryne amazonica]XP_034036781.1 RELT-like protein 2 [Thalassophryne amazonica]
MTDVEASGVGEHPPPYMIFVVVFLFFLTGLLGFLICHLLKKKGYRCRTADMEEEEKLGGNSDDEHDENQDTVEQILKCIIENEANMEAFKEMLGNQNVCVRHDPRLRKESIGGVPLHHHTVHSGSAQNSCHLCAQGRHKKNRQSRAHRYKQRPGEQTVFSVGRFRVTHTDKKVHGDPSPLVSSGDQLDQSQDNEERRGSGYNLRNMFNDVRPPSDNSKGVDPNVGKRRKSLTLFGLRRGSDPTGVKGGGYGIAKEAGGMKFAVHQHPVVLEEPLQVSVQAECSEATCESGTKPTALQAPPCDVKTSGSVWESLSSQTDRQDHDSERGSLIKPSVESTQMSVPSSLLLPVSVQKTKKATPINTDWAQQGTLEKPEDMNSPGPLQTSTPMGVGPASIRGISPVISTGSSVPVSHTSPERSSSLDRPPGIDSRSLSSSPPSFSVKTPSSVSSLKIPASPLTVPVSPKLNSTQVIPSQTLVPASSLGRSSGLLQADTPSPDLSAGSSSDIMQMTPPNPPTDQTPPTGTSPRMNVKSEGVMLNTSLTLTEGEEVSKLLPQLEQKLEEASILKTGEKSAKERTGLLERDKLFQNKGDLTGSVCCSSEARQSSLPLSASTLLPSSSAAGSRISSVTIVKASPESLREFAVVTMVEIENPPASSHSQSAEVSDADSHRAEASGSEVTQPKEQRPQRPEVFGEDVQPTMNQDKDDMMEMEDIRKCNVMQVEQRDRR